MNKKMVLSLTVCSLVSIIAGAALERAIYVKKNTFGELKINKTNPEKDSYSIEVYDIEKLENKKRIILNITNEK